MAGSNHWLRRDGHGVISEGRDDGAYTHRLPIMARYRKDMGPAGMRLMESTVASIPDYVTTALSPGVVLDEFKTRPQ